MCTRKIASPIQVTLTHMVIKLKRLVVTNVLEQPWPVPRNSKKLKESIYCLSSGWLCKFTSYFSHGNGNKFMVKNTVSLDSPLHCYDQIPQLIVV